MIKFHCVRCQQRIGVAEAHAGRKINCPQCETPLEIPPRQAEAPPTQPADLQVIVPDAGANLLAKMVGKPAAKARRRTPDTT